MSPSRRYSFNYRFCIRFTVVLACLALVGWSKSIAASQEAMPDVLDPVMTLLARIPEDARIVIVSDFGPDNASVRALRATPPEDSPDYAGWKAAQRMKQDVVEAVSRLVRVFGLESTAFDGMTTVLGPRYVKALLSPEKDSKLPRFLVLASVANREEADRRLHRIVSSLARNAVESTESLGDGRLHVWSNLPHLPVKLVYYVGDGVAGISSSVELLRAAMSSSGGTVPAWLPPLMETQPEGLVSWFVSPKIVDLFGDMIPENTPKPADLGIRGMAGTLSLLPDGLLVTGATLADKEGMIPMLLSAASKVPVLSDDAFRLLPQSSLAAVAISSPAEWVKASPIGMMLMASGGDNPDEAGHAAVLKTAMTALDGEMTLSLQALLPVPSAMMTIASDNESEAESKRTALLDMAKAMKLDPPISVAPGADGSSVAVMKLPKGPISHLQMARQGRHLVAATDNRSMESARELLDRETGSLSESETFRQVRSHLGEELRVITYLDLSVPSGLGMLASHGLLVGTPLGMEAARAFRAVRGMGTGIEFHEDRIVGRTFVSGDPSNMLPTVGGAAIGAAAAAFGLVMPKVAQSREKAREAQCMNNAKQLAILVIQYAEKNNALPKADMWTGQLKSLGAADAVLHCPSAGESDVSYAMNTKLSRLPFSKIADPSRTVLFYETTQKVANPHGIGTDAARRHGGGVIVAYADGHVEVIRGDLPIESFRPVR